VRNTVKTQPRAAIASRVPQRMSRREACEYLQTRLGRGVGYTTLVYGWALPFYRDGGRAVYRKSDLDQFIQKRIAACDPATPRLAYTAGGCGGSKP
jgi:hypothetical protein